MQAPPGPSGPQLSPDGNYWWDGVRWVALTRPQPYWQQIQPARPLAPSPGLRPFLIVVLVISDVATGLLALFGFLALMDYLFGPTSGPPADATDYALIAFFFVLFALMLAATIGVVRRSRWARVVTIVAGGAVCLTCLGVVLGIPIIVAGARAPMTRPAPSGYA